jgi:hypothetical protein
MPHEFLLKLMVPDDRKRSMEIKTCNTLSHIILSNSMAFQEDKLRGFLNIVALPHPLVWP